MNFKRFLVTNTNIFPIANSHAGGQLTTEWNLRARESVATDPAITYNVGPSYAHSASDFEVVDNLNTGIRISAGRALVNGHYVESLSDIDIDLAETNIALQQEGNAPLRGKLVVGLVAIYSTQYTMAGSMLTEDPETGLYEGIQIVILPKDGVLGEKFTLPSDSPDDESKVNAHLKLAEFEFYNSTIVSGSIVNNPNKTTLFSADRVGNISSLVSDIYVTKSGLQPNKLYTFAGKGTDPETGKDTWCDSTDSLMIWDPNPQVIHGDDNGSNPGVKRAYFRCDINGVTYLVLPHKQVDGMTDSSGNPLYYKDVYLDLPVASYTHGTGGTVDARYTNSIRDIERKIDRFYTLPEGKMKQYIAELVDRTDLPRITQNAGWVPGDYVLVGQDASIPELDESSARLPSTMYVVIPGLVKTIEYIGSSESQDDVPGGLEGGVQLGFYDYDESNEYSLNPTDIDVVSSFWDFVNNGYRGIPGKDYFCVKDSQSPITTYNYINEKPDDWDANYTNYYVSTPNGPYPNAIADWDDALTYANTAPNTGIMEILYSYNYYFYPVATADPKEYSEPVWVTGQIPFATEDVIGGFLNVSDGAYGQGYVRLTEDGHLQLLDYSLLSTGVLAYQLGQDYTVTSGLTISGVQEELDEYVNNRVAFPNTAQTTSTSSPDVINIYIELTNEDEPDATLNIMNIDSRFNTSIYVHLTGTVTENTIINFIDCEKLRIDNQLSGAFVLNLFRCSLYYDANVINNLTTIYGMKLWYERFNSTDLNLVINDMTVELAGTPNTIANEEYWNESSANDTHYSYALKALTFAHDGTIMGMKLLVTDNITSNIRPSGRYIAVFPFEIPQTASLPYPTTKITKQLKVTGTFTTMYPLSSVSSDGYMVKDTNFSAISQWYDTQSNNELQPGMISFITTISEVENVAGISATMPIDSFETGAFQQFVGGTVS